MHKTMKKGIKRVLGIYFPLVLFLVFTLFPFYWILNTSLKSSQEVFSTPLTYWPQSPTFDNYINLFKNLGFGTYFKNSFIVSISVTSIVALLSMIGGYAMSRYKFKGKSLVYVVMLCSQMFPSVVLMIPLFQMMNSMGLINNLMSLIIISSCTNLSFCMFMMMGYYNAIPPSLEEAAQVDGCTLLRAVFTVVIPTMKPSIVATGAYAFINSWNIFVYATAFITRKQYYTVPLGLNMFKGEFSTNYAGLAAGCVVALIPVLIIFAFIQRHLTGGITSGAVKG